MICSLGHKHLYEKASKEIPHAKAPKQMVSCDSFQKCRSHTIDQGDEYRVNRSLNFVWRDFPNSKNLIAQSVNVTTTIHYSLLHSST